MNIIGIMLDSFRQDHVSFYHEGKPVFEGVSACKTPNLDAFARESIVFQNAYPEALPTIPVRTQFFTGQSTLPYRPWQPLVKEDLTAAEILRGEGYVNGLITDCYHYRTPGMNFHRGFHAYDWIRGQEYDTWKSNPTRRNIEDYVNDNYDKGWRERISQYLSNTDDILQEEDYFPARVAASACEWLALNRSHPRIFAWIDSFDPHEPWDPPSRFDNYTDPAYKGKRLIFPMGNLLADQWATPEEIRYIRGLYAGEAAFVDHCVGQVLQTLKELGYYDDSVIFITADHGHPLGDHNKFLKGGGRLYSELLKVPFMVRCPGAKCARRTDAIVQFHDVLPTVLELAGLGNTTSAMQGRSFLPVLLGDSDTHRSEIITGYHESAVRCIRDSKWTYIQRAEGEPDELYNLEDDPREQKNLIDEFPEEAKRLASTFGRNFRKKGAQTAVKGIQKRYELAGLG